MSDAPRAGDQHRRPHASAMAAPFLEFDLTTEIARLRQEPEGQAGQNAKTLVKYDDLRIVLIALKAGDRLPVHQTGGRLSIQTVAGHIHMRAEGRTFDLPAGRLLALDQAIPHDVEALEESAILLTIAWPGRQEKP
jgi:quercetin dioxygenase-like cupin family protein